MNEITLLLIVTITLSGWILFVIVALTVADLQTIALEKALRRHPHARKWRSVTKLRAQLQLYGDERFLSHSALRFALARFQAKPSTRFVEILPRLAFPQTTTQLFAAYHTFALAPFVKLRRVINVRSRQHWPILIRPTIVKTRLERCYLVASWLLSCVNVFLFAYVCFIATLGEASYLLTYIAAFALWLAWSVCNYPAIAFSHRVIYILLIPMSFGYFLFRAIAAPFMPLRLLRLLATRRPVLS